MNTDVQELINILVPATWDTIYMVGWSALFSVILGGILGILLYLTNKGSVMEFRIVNTIIGTVVNIGRSIPFVIIIIAVFPLSRFIVGTSIGRTAAIVPLTIAAIPFVARLAESIFNELDKGVIEAAITSGATIPQIILKVLIPETAPGLITGMTITIISLIGFSAMAGMIGAGGLGDVANTYGYQRFRTDILMYTVVILVILVQIIQIIGNTLSRAVDKR